MISTNSIPFIRSDGPVCFELQDQGRVLIIKDALFNPRTNKYHTIQLVQNGWKFLGFDLGGGGKFTGITPDVVRQIQMTYGILLKTLGSEPKGEAFWGDEKKTFYLTEGSGFWRALNVKTSYPFGQKKNDLLLSQEDAAQFGAAQMTLHDAVNAGIWNAIDAKGGSALSSTKGSAGGPPVSCRGKRENKGEASEKPISAFPSIPGYRAKSTLLETGYDAAPFEERKRRIIAHLDRSSPIPFSAFVDGNEKRGIDAPLFRRMSDALQRLAANPKADDKDAKYMKELLTHWFRAAYHYLDKNSKPGDGYQQILDKMRGKDAEKAEKKAKELYWRRHATDFWMTLVDLFAAKKIDIDPLRKALSIDTSLNPWFY